MVPLCCLSTQMVTHVWQQQSDGEKLDASLQTCSSAPTRPPDALTAAPHRRRVHPVRNVGEAPRSPCVHVCACRVRVSCVLCGQRQNAVL